MSSCLDLSGFFEKEVRMEVFDITFTLFIYSSLPKEIPTRIHAYLLDLQDVSERNIRFTSNLFAKDLIERLQDIVTEMGFTVQKKNGIVSIVAYIIKSFLSLTIANK